MWINLVKSVQLWSPRRFVSWNFHRFTQILFSD